MKHKKKQLMILLAVLFAALYVSRNLYQLNLIQGESMYPAYQNMQFTIIDRRAAEFQHGDVIVFYCPALDSTMVKRVIAVPGETVCISDGIVMVDGAVSPHVNGFVNFSGTASKELLLDSDSFFVMGDNHALSKDSRYEEIGCISRKNIIGRLIPNRPVTTNAEPHP